MCVLSASRVRLWYNFGCTFVDFSGFVILLKLCSRVGGSTFLRVWVGPALVFFTRAACKKENVAYNIKEDLSISFWLKCQLLAQGFEAA